MKLLATIVCLFVVGCAAPVWQQELNSKKNIPIYFGDFYQEPDRSKPFDWGISETRYR